MMVSEKIPFFDVFVIFAHTHTHTNKYVFFLFMTTPTTTMEGRDKLRVFLSFDVEATGPAPGRGSMVMLGVTVARLNDDNNTNNDDDDTKEIREDNVDRWVLDEKCWCLDELDGRDEQCWNEFWVHHLDVWERIQRDKKHPSIVMKELNDWLILLKEKYDVVFWLAYPAAFDWQWLNYTWVKYGGPSKTTTTGSTVVWTELGYKCECMNSYKYVVPLTPEQKADLSAFKQPKTLIATHDALDDARSQAYQFLKLREWFEKTYKR